MEQPALRITDFTETLDAATSSRRARDLRAARYSPAAAQGSVDAATMLRFERALAETVTTLMQRFQSPVSEHVLWHFGIGCEEAALRGKRLRPRLLLQVAFDEGGTYESALDGALSIELLHNYSLVHDDIEDGDEVRRGRQTVWSRYGLPNGVNAGDAICAVTYLTLLRNSGGAPLDRVMSTARILQGANLAMCAGQGYDLGFESARNVTLEAYLAMIEGKTAVLFGAACELGALSAGSDPVRAGAFARVGRAYGRAFQIRDDIAGIASDIARRKWTFPIVWALAGPPSAARSAIAGRYARFEMLERADIELVAEALDELGARRAAERACAEHFREAARIAQRHRLDRAGNVRAMFAPAQNSKAIA
jgi:geranylgeranyl diphosphate synthase type I